MSQNTLYNFLNNSRNSLAREAITRHKLLYDLKFSAALNNYHLDTYYTEVDNEGFDIILDDKDQFRKIQVKTVLSGASTKSWKIHKTFLRPDIRFLENFGFPGPPEGSQGGVILMELEPKKNNMTSVYYYTDVFIIFAFYMNIIKRTNQISQKTLRKLFAKIRDRGSLYDKIQIPKSAFLQTKSSEHLLGLMGFHSAKGSWHIHNLMLIASKQYHHISKKYILPAPIDVLKKIVGVNISEFVEDKLI